MGSLPWGEFCVSCPSPLPISRLPIMPRALVSVSDKSGLVPFVQGLVDLGFEIVSTGGTRRHLDEAGIPTIDVASVTGFPEMMEGRVKTLHPLVHGAILGRPTHPGDAASIAEHGIVPFEVVVCNLYLFEQTVAQPGVTAAEAIEKIDVGGPSMVRAAAKNHAHVAIVSDPAQYDDVLAALRDNTLDELLRRKLAAAAFKLSARYEAAIADYMAKLTGDDGEGDDPFPSELSLSFQKRSTLRYGENPHQQAAFYVEKDAGPTTLAAAEQLHGKELSYNNLLDLDAALGLVRDLAHYLGQPSLAVLKHNNPCGCGLGDDIATALERAWAGDPVSAFGSILGSSTVFDAAAAEILCQPNRFVEAIIAPDFTAEALELLTTKPTWKNSVRLIKLPGLSQPAERIQDYRRVSGGLLVQDKDEELAPIDSWQTVTDRAPTEEETRDLLFAWIVCKHVRSNAIVFGKNGMITGVGAGQMSRLDSAMIAARKSEGRCQSGVCASDAFFPFRDGVDQAAAAGIKAIVQPGGSRRDEESIAAANEHDIAMLFTGRRHFRH